MNQDYERELGKILEEMSECQLQLEIVNKQLKKYGYKNIDQASDLVGKNLNRKDAAITAFVYMGLFAGSMLFPATALLQILQGGLLLVSGLQVVRLVKQNKQRRLIEENIESIIESIKLRDGLYERYENANIKLQNLYNETVADEYKFYNNNQQTNNTTNTPYYKNNSSQKQNQSEKDDDRTL